MESAIGFELTETPGISSWPSLERQGLPVDSDEQRDTKKVKNRSDDSDLPGSKLSGVVESVPNPGNNGDVSMMDYSRDSGVRNAAAIQPKEGVHDSTIGRSYAAAAAGTGVSEGTGRIRLSLEDIEVLDDDVTVDVSGPFPVICFSDRVHEEIDKSMERSLIVRLLGDIHLVDLENDYYLVKFAAEEDYTKVLKEGPWTIFGSYLTVQTWSRGFSTSQVFPSQVIVWVRLPGFPYRYYTKSLFRRIAAVLGRVVRVDYNTKGGDRGKFARLAVMLDLTKPLRSCIGIDGFIQRLEYEGLQNICFGCGTYGHAKEHCGTSELAEVSHNGNGNRAFPLSNKKVDKVAAEDLFGPWMVVEDRRRRARRTDTSGAHMPPGTSGLRFEMLNNLSADVDASSIGNSIGGSGKEPSVQAGPQRSVTRKNGYQGKIVAMELGRVSEIILTNGIGSTAQHQAITIVGNGDSREEGSGSISRAGLKGIGKKKVQFKKKPELKFPAGGLTFACSEMVNIRNDVSRRRFSCGEDNSGKPPDNLGLTGRTPLNDTRVTNMLQFDEDRDPGLIERIVRQYDPSLVVLFETRVGGRRANSVIRRLGFECSFRVEARGFRGGIWILWKSAVDVKFLYLSNQYIHMEVMENGMSSPVFVTAVYGSPSIQFRKHLWSQLEDLDPGPAKPWVLGGDFNAISNAEDRRGGSLSRSGISKGFSDFIFDTGVVDVPFRGPRFTWFQGLLYQRLDRVLMNSKWACSFLDSVVWHLEKIGSDHRPLLLQSCLSIRPTVERPFRYVFAWHEHPGFRNELLRSWDQGANILDNLQHCRDNLAVWNESIFGHIGQRKRRILARHRGIDRALNSRYSVYLVELEKSLKAELVLFVSKRRVYGLRSLIAIGIFMVIITQKFFMRVPRAVAVLILS
ncbi:hypothetical protein GQ457_07G011820 [Hibiscus cannabinus]